LLPDYDMAVGEGQTPVLRHCVVRRDAAPLIQIKPGIAPGDTMVWFSYLWGMRL